jgi:hypothetical protein
MSWTLGQLNMAVILMARPPTSRSELSNDRGMFTDSVQLELELELELAIKVVTNHGGNTVDIDDVHAACVEW